jgi:hypothetical protein
MLFLWMLWAVDALGNDDLGVKQRSSIDGLGDERRSSIDDPGIDDLNGEAILCILTPTE